MRADNGRAKGEGGGITLPVGAGAEPGSERFLLVLTPSDEVVEEERLLDLELFDRGEVGREVSAGAVDVKDVELAELEVVATESVEGCEVSAGFSGKVKRVPVGRGVMRVGDSFERKSRYAAGGVIGVFWLSSCLMNVGVPTHGLRISDGNEAESGVFNDGNWGLDVVAMLDESCSSKLDRVASWKGGQDRREKKQDPN